MTVNQKTLFDEGKLALERMCRDIRDARSITAPAAGGSGSSITFIRNNATAQDGAGETITFQLNRKHSGKGQNITQSLTSAMAEMYLHLRLHGELQQIMRLKLQYSPSLWEAVRM